MVARPVAEACGEGMVFGLESSDVGLATFSAVCPKRTLNFILGLTKKMTYLLPGV